MFAMKLLVLPFIQIGPRLSDFHRTLRRHLDLCFYVPQDIDHDREIIYCDCDWFATGQQYFTWLVSSKSKKLQYEARLSSVWVAICQYMSVSIICSSLTSFWPKSVLSDLIASPKFWSEQASPRSSMKSDCKFTRVYISSINQKYVKWINLEEQKYYVCSKNSKESVTMNEPSP